MKAVVAAGLVVLALPFVLPGALEMRSARDAEAALSKRSQKTAMLFTAAGCGACVAAKKALATAAVNAPEVVVFAVDMNEADDLTTRLGVRFAPTLVLVDSRGARIAASPFVGDAHALGSLFGDSL